MKVSWLQTPVADFQGSALVLTAVGGNPLGGSLMGIAPQADEIFSDLHKRGEIRTKLGELTILYGVSGIAAESIVIVGCGDGELDSARATICAGAASKRLAARPRGRIGFYFGKLEGSVSSAAICGAMNGCVGQDLFRAEKNLHSPEEMLWLCDLDNHLDARGFHAGVVLGESVLLTRELVNLPPNLLYPESFVRRAIDVAVSRGLEFEVWDEMKLRRERCGALLAVAAGSAKPPRLLILRYAGQKKQPPLALVGKGVTFDSGGLSLKPSEGMLAMKCDMAGAATVLGAMNAIAALNVSSPVVGLVGLVENMVSGSSYKLGDVLQSRCGKTIEIHNTDAEGRLVLADTLSVACDERPSRIIDLATLTGACLVALGTEVAGLMSNDEGWQREVQETAAEVGERVWPLPMFSEYGEQIQSKVADIKNVGEGRWAGAITAAKFLEEFVGDVPWAHLDIAGPAFSEKPKSHLDAGASGALVRTLVRLASRA